MQTACLLASCISAPLLPTPTPAPPTPAYLRVVFDVVDDVTGQPVNADITIRRERLDGSQVEGEKFFTGQHLEIDIPVNPDERIFVLVEAQGYADWEVGMRAKMAGTLNAPIRLKPIATPGPQG